MDASGSSINKNITFGQIQTSPQEAGNIVKTVTAQIGGGATYTITVKIKEEAIEDQFLTQIDQLVEKFLQEKVDEKMLSTVADKTESFKVTPNWGQLSLKIQKEAAKTEIVKNKTLNLNPAKIIKKFIAKIKEKKAAKAEKKELAEIRKNQSTYTVLNLNLKSFKDKITHADKEFGQHFLEQFETLSTDPKNGHEVLDYIDNALEQNMFKKEEEVHDFFTYMQGKLSPLFQKSPEEKLQKTESKKFESHKKLFKKTEHIKAGLLKAAAEIGAVEDQLSLNDQALIFKLDRALENITNKEFEAAEEKLLELDNFISQLSTELYSSDLKEVIQNLKNDLPFMILNINSKKAQKEAAKAKIDEIEIPPDVEKAPIQSLRSHLNQLNEALKEYSKENEILEEPGLSMFDLNLTALINQLTSATPSETAKEIKLTIQPYLENEDYSHLPKPLVSALNQMKAALPDLLKQLS